MDISAQLKRKRLLLLTVIILFISIVSGLNTSRFWIQPYFKNDHMHASAGVLELHSPLNNTDIVPLAGQWRFYPDEVKQPADIDWSEPARKLLTIPDGGWDKQMSSAFGKGTYAIEIRLADSQPMLGLKTFSIRMAHRLYVNGELAGRGGIMSDEGQYQSENYPYRSYVSLGDSRVVQIVIQVENNLYGRSGGIVAPIVIGTPHAIDYTSNITAGFDMLRALSYLLGGIMFICFYIMWPSRNYPLYAGLHLLGLALYVLTHSEKLLNQWIPSMPFDMFIVVQMVSVLLSAYTITMYVHRLFPSRFGVYLVKAMRIACVGFILLNMMLPYAVLSQYELAIGAPLLIGYLFAVWRFGAAMTLKQDNAVICLLSALHLVILYINSFLNVNGWLPNSAFAPWDAITFMILQLLLIGKRFANLSERTEELSRKIIEVNEAKQLFIRQNAFQLQAPLHKADKLIEIAIQQSSLPMMSEQSRQLETARMLINQQLDHVHDLVDLTELREGKSAMLSPVLVKESLQSVFRHLKAMPECEGVHFDPDIPLAFPVALGDESRFRHVIRKLIIASVQPGALVRADGLVLPDKEVCLELHISGAALSKEQAAEMMALEVDQKESFTSRTMHLIMAFQWMKQLGGELAVKQETAEDELVFELTLGSIRPALRSWKRGDGRPKNVASGTIRDGEHDHGSIMLISTDLVNLDIVSAILSGQGYDMVHCTSGHAALEYVKEQPLLDLIICDQLVSGMSGIELCAEIRKSYSSAVLPFLLIVSPLEPQERLAAFRADVNDIVVYPYEASELIGRVGNMVSMKHSMETSLQMEQAFLQAQIKPHFLYNAMNSILSLSYSDVEKARQVIFDLSDYLRFSFDFTNTRHSVPLSQELELVQAYLNIESVRYGNRLRYELDCDERIGVQIPPLTLQPIVENAVRHGIAPVPEGGNIRVVIRKSEDKVIAIISDNGIGMDKQRLAIIQEDEMMAGHVGLLNIRKRLNRLSATMTIESEPGAGTTTTLIFPARREIEV
ncbi:histidine kinase [Paenibacillus sp. GCM10012307]|uniref:Histidine kinase n=1 Tax=Paenibacillus roseus TaxID=2798579 RepID=A0A934MUR5_9BACL|nr:histidine kinase [Paenibacillus roseus]MBJ6361362.1 histidine kinase [Paenibacillus roseus]